MVQTVPGPVGGARAPEPPLLLPLRLNPLLLLGALAECAVLIPILLQRWLALATDGLAELALVLGPPLKHAAVTSACNHA